MNKHSDGSWVRAGLVGAVLGGVVGFTLGLVLAPEEGRKLRRRMVYQLDSLSGQVSKILDTVLQDDDAVSEARKRGDAVVADAWAESRRLHDDIDAAINKAREQSQQSSVSK